jgi:hypothetical protein
VIREYVRTYEKSGGGSAPKLISSVSDWGVALIHVSELRAVGAEDVAAAECSRAVVYLVNVRINYRSADTSVGGLNVTAILDGDAAGNLVALVHLGGLRKTVGRDIAATDCSQAVVCLANGRIDDFSKDAGVVGLNVAAIIDGDVGSDLVALMRLGGLRKAKGVRAAISKESFTAILLRNTGINDRSGNTRIVAVIVDCNAAGDVVALMCLSGLHEAIVDAYQYSIGDYLGAGIGLIDSICRHRTYFASIIDGNVGLNAVALVDIHNLREDVREIRCRCPVVGERDIVNVFE